MKSSPGVKSAALCSRFFYYLSTMKIIYCLYLGDDNRVRQNPTLHLIAMIGPAIPSLTTSAKHF